MFPTNLSRHWTTTIAEQFGGPWCQGGRRGSPPSVATMGRAGKICPRTPNQERTGAPQTAVLGVADRLHELGRIKYEHGVANARCGPETSRANSTIHRTSRNEGLNMKPVKSALGTIAAALMAFVLAGIPVSLVLYDLGSAVAGGMGGGGGMGGSGGGMGGGGGTGGSGGGTAGSGGGMGGGSGMGSPASGMSGFGMGAEDHGQAGMSPSMSDQGPSMGRDAGQGQGHMGRGSDMATPGRAGSPQATGKTEMSTSGMRSNNQSMNPAMQDTTRERGARQSEMAAEDHDIAGARDRESHQ
jgi:hypothetical protein